jgi:hypothetical protein
MKETLGHFRHVDHVPMRLYFDNIMSIMRFALI